MGAKHFGARVTRLEDPALLAGRGRFVDDVKLPGTLHACFVRSPHAHAKLRGFDTRATLAMPGVHAVITADDLPEPMRSDPLPLLLPNPALAAPRTQQVLARADTCPLSVAFFYNQWNMVSQSDAARRRVALRALVEQSVTGNVLLEER